LRRRHSREFDAIVLYADECVPSTNEQLATELENDAADVAQRTIGAAGIAGVAGCTRSAMGEGIRRPGNGAQWERRRFRLVPDADAAMG
jgi:hypothetical protein